MAHPMQHYGPKNRMTCEQCGEYFERVTAKGPIPKYCSQACRQRAYEDRNPRMTREEWRATIDYEAAAAKYQTMYPAYDPTLIGDVIKPVVDAALGTSE